MGATFTWGVAQLDLENALNKATVLALFDDGPPVAGIINATALAAVFLRGEQDLVSWLINAYAETGTTILPADLASDPFLKSAAIDFCVARAIDRHPEYVKTRGFGTAESYRAQAEAMAERIQAGRQRATTIIEKPANVGGPVTSIGPTMYGVDADGCSHAGDF